jgi:hypothetical protein
LDSRLDGDHPLLGRSRLALGNRTLDRLSRASPALRSARPPGRPSIDRLACLAWDAAEAALPPDGACTLLPVGRAQPPRLSGRICTDRIRVSAQEAAAALFALAVELRARHPGARGERL